MPMLDDKITFQYGFAVIRPDFVSTIVPPSKAELRAIKWAVFKDAVVQTLLIAAVFICWSFSFIAMMKLANV